MATKHYLIDAQRHFERIKYYYDHGGANGHSQAIYHHSKLSDCYSKSGAKLLDEVPAIYDLYIQAEKLMKIMKRRENGLPDEEDLTEKH